MKDRRLIDFDKLPGWAQNLFRVVFIFALMGWVAKGIIYLFR